MPRGTDQQHHVAVGACEGFLGEPGHMSGRSSCGREGATLASGAHLPILVPDDSFVDFTNQGRLFPQQRKPHAGGVSV